MAVAHAVTDELSSIGAIPGRYGREWQAACSPVERRNHGLAQNRTLPSP